MTYNRVLERMEIMNKMTRCLILTNVSFEKLLAYRDFCCVVLSNFYNYKIIYYSKVVSSLHRKYIIKFRGK
jgi:hypothetical protein